MGRDKRTATKMGRCCKVETGEYDTAMDSANLSNMLSEHLRACLVLPFLAVYAMFHAVRFRQQKTNKQKSGDCGIYYCNLQTRHIACQRAKLTLMCVHWGIFQQYMPPSMCYGTFLFIYSRIDLRLVKKKMVCYSKMETVEYYTSASTTKEKQQAELIRVQVCICHF